MQLTGAQEVPPVTTGGSGTVETTFDKSTNVLTWTVTYSGLSGPVTAGHYSWAGSGRRERRRGYSIYR